MRTVSWQSDPAARLHGDSDMSRIRLFSGPATTFGLIVTRVGHIDRSIEALFTNLRRSPPPPNLDTSCQIHGRTPPPRLNWGSQTTFLCAVKGGFCPQTNGFATWPAG